MFTSYLLVSNAPLRTLFALTIIGAQCFFWILAASERKVRVIFTQTATGMSVYLSVLSKLLQKDGFPCPVHMVVHRMDCLDPNSDF